MLASTTDTSNKRLFTLIYAERPSSSDALVCLNGPSVHNSEQEALETLWSYVQNRIIETCKEEFVESAFDLGVDLFQFTPDDDEPVTEDEFDAILSSLADENLKVVVDWYFELMNDEICECFYKIDKHLITERKDEISEISSEVDPASKATIRAEAHSDDRLVEIEFNAAPYFASELKNGNLKVVIEALDGCDFGCDYPADTVAEYFADNRTKRLFDYMSFKGGYECSIKKEDVVIWLKEFAPKYVSLID